MTINKKIFTIIALGLILISPISNASAQQPNVDALIAQLKSENPLEQLKAFNKLEITNEEVMSNLVDAIHQKPCAYQFLENFSLSEKASDFIEVLKQKIPPSKDLQSEYCNYYSMGTIQFPF